MEDSFAKRRRLSVTIMSSDGYMRSLDEIVGDVLTIALSHFSVPEAARQLGIGRSTIYRKLEAVPIKASPVRQRKRGSLARKAVIARPSANEGSERFWKLEHVAMLSEMWQDPQYNISDVALALGRTREAVKLKAQRLGLKRHVTSTRIYGT